MHWKLPAVLTQSALLSHGVCLPHSLMSEAHNHMSLLQGGPKNRTCLSVANSAMVSGRKTCDTSIVSECCKEWNVWRITRRSSTIHCWVINAQTGPVFWPTLYYSTPTPLLQTHAMKAICHKVMTIQLFLSVPLLWHSKGQIIKSLASVCHSVSLSVNTPTAEFWFDFDEILHSDSGPEK